MPIAGFSLRLPAIVLPVPGQGADGRGDAIKIIEVEMTSKCHCFGHERGVGHQPDADQGGGETLGIGEQSSQRFAMLNDGRLIQQDAGDDEVFFTGDQLSTQAGKAGGDSEICKTILSQQATK